MAHLTQSDLEKIRAFFERVAEKQDAEDAAATEVFALKVTLNVPQPDGPFEILFVTRKDADRIKSTVGKDRNTYEEISFAEGVELARRPDCSGGAHALQYQAARLQTLNPLVQALRLNLD